MWVGQPTHSIIKLEIYMPRYKKADKVQRTDELVIGQWMNDSRLAHVRDDGVKVFIHPHDELGSVAKRFKNIHALAEAGHADLDDPVSVQVTLKGMTSEENIRHLEAIARIIQSHVDSAKKVQALKEVPVEIREATIKAIDSFQEFLQAENE